MIKVYPNPKDRSWTKEEWKKNKRMSKIMEKLITPEMEKKAEDAYIQALIYGQYPMKF